MGKTLLQKYEEKSQNPEYECYNPLQCAVYDGQMVDVQVLIKELRHHGPLQLKEALEYRNGNFGETILHVAIKHPRIFELCCDALKKINSFEQIVSAKDSDGDTIMHQIVEFGRVEALEILMNDDDARPLLADLIEQKNNHEETAENILVQFYTSKTISHLKEQNILDEEKLIHSQNSLVSLLPMFEEIKSPAMSFGM